MKKIIITGGAGFVGSHTALELLKARMEPIIIDNFSNSHKKLLANLESLAHTKIKTYEADCRDQAKINKIFKTVKADGVIHFAAYKSVRDSLGEPLEYYDNNIASLVGVLKAMEQSGIKNLVFSSSCTVYGQAKKFPITEDTPFGPPLSPYGFTKQIGEKIINDTTVSTGSIKAICLRYFNAVGAHPSSKLGEASLANPTFLMPRILQILSGKSSPTLEVYGGDYPTPDGTCIRDYIHVQDLATAHTKAMRHLFKQGGGYFECFNVGTGRGNSVLEVIKTFEKITGREIPFSFRPRAAGDAVISYASAVKAKEILGWGAKYSLEDAVAHAWKWQQNLTLSKR